MRSITVPLITLALSLPPLARAAESRVAVVDVRRAVYEVEEGKAASAVLKKEFDDKQKQLDAKQTELQQASADFEKQMAVLADPVKQAKQAELDKRFGELRTFAMQQQQDLSAKEQEAMKSIFDRMSGVVKDIAEAEGFQVIIDRGGVVWSVPSMDVTNEVIRKYNSKYPAKGEAGSPKAEPAKAEVAKPAAKPSAKK